MLLFSFGAGLEGAAMAREDAPGEGQDSSACQAVKLVVVLSFCWFSESSNSLFDRNVNSQTYCHLCNCSLRMKKIHCTSPVALPTSLSSQPVLSLTVLCKVGSEHLALRREANPTWFKCEWKVSSLGKGWFSLWCLFTLWCWRGFCVLGTSWYHSRSWCQ